MHKKRGRPKGSYKKLERQMVERSGSVPSDVVDALMSPSAPIPLNNPRAPMQSPGRRRNKRKE